MIDHLLRVPKQSLYAPLARRLALPPNTLTAVGLALGLASAGCCWAGWWKGALAFWCANRFFDGLDGEVARAHQSQTDLGGYLDIMADLIVYAAVPLGLAQHDGTRAVGVATGLMLASFYLNLGSWMYLSSILEKRGEGAQKTGELTTVAMPRGLIEGAETVLFFTIFLLAPQHLAMLFGTFALLTLTGAALRVRWAYQNL